MGSASYREMAPFWSQSEHPYAAVMNDIPKVVFSQSLSDSEAAWPTNRVARGDLATENAAQPVAVGSGKPLFGRLPAARYLHLVEARFFSCGVVVHIYTPQQGPAAEWAPAGTAEEG